MKINQFWLRMMGISGIVGGLILFSGDMLLYYDSSHTNLKINMGHASDLRIVGSGVAALLATWLYMLGLGQVYYALKPANVIMRNTIVLSFGAILIAYGIVHAAYIAIAVTAKLAIQFELDMQTATSLAAKTNHMIRLFVYPIFALLSLVFISQVWKKKTLYPRWIILFFPLTPYLFKDLISSFLSGSAWIVIIGGFLNLMLALFFTASTIALWNIKPRTDDS